jgi:hypothetical protein
MHRRESAHTLDQMTAKPFAPTIWNDDRNACRQRRRRAILCEGANQHVIDTFRKTIPPKRDSPSLTDHGIAFLVVENELELRQLVTKSAPVGPDGLVVEQELGPDIRNL